MWIKESSLLRLIYMVKGSILEETQSLYVLNCLGAKVWNDYHYQINGSDSLLQLLLRYEKLDEQAKNAIITKNIIKIKVSHDKKKPESI